MRSYGSPQEDRSLVYWYVDFGLKLTRPFRGRAEDVLSLGFAYLDLSDRYVDSERARGENVSRRESVLELTYRLQMTGCSASSRTSSSSSIRTSAGVTQS